MEDWQNERIVKYFLLTANRNRYKIMILEQSSNENAKLGIDKLFDDKQIALNLIELLCKN